MDAAFRHKKPKTVLVLGSGALQIGQAGEFDYSGSQALKALREEKVETILINPNIGTIQTSKGMADQIYLQSVTPERVEKIIRSTSVDAILLSVGGQTALNCGVSLEQKGVLRELGVRVLGTQVQSILDTEDRQRFTDRLHQIDVKTAKSVACSDRAQAEQAVKEFGYPVMLRGAWALGGQGSGIVESKAQLSAALDRAFANQVPQVLVEECLRGWKEIEYEIVRDARDNCIAVCNMENLDPMGIHTGESIVVAPSQTLNDEEYQRLRSVALTTVRHLNIVGECNIQYALNPQNGDYRVIEVNARLSRSSALASKATGYPLAYVSTKIALGYTLPEIPNGVTQQTTAFFEPALDYIIVKVPRWDLTKFSESVKTIGSEMKSVGEVMSIGRTLPEALQKALRMLDIGVRGLDPGAFEFDDIHDELQHATPRRIFAIARAFADGMSVTEVQALTNIDPWFLHSIKETVQVLDEMQQEELSDELLLKAKKYGFSDQKIEEIYQLSTGTVRKHRGVSGICPHVAQIDTLAAEFPAETNYLYQTYHADQSDITPTSSTKKIMVLGSGAYRIGSSVEFDWCCVNAVETVADAGYETIMLNFNPETVSTDYDTCDRLYFEEISLESVLDIYETEQPAGLIVSMGGQIANNLALRLAECGVTLLGTPAEYIDMAEDRRKFSALLDKLHIDQPKWFHVTDITKADSAVDDLDGYPVLVRPSYVLSGAAMSVAHEPHELRSILSNAKRVSPDHPVVVSKFELHAREIEFDAVADNGEIIDWAISEHIEDAGIHSGDATLVIPPQKLYIATIRKIREIGIELAEALQVTGPFNVQFLAKQNAVKVIECNLRASRSFPFVSKVLNQNFAAEAVRCMLGISAGPHRSHTLEVDHVGVKVPMFSFMRLVGVDPILGVEMASTGEVGCIGDDVHEALLNGLLATGFQPLIKNVLLSLGPTQEKYWFSDELKILANELNFNLYATDGTAHVLADMDLDCVKVKKSGSAKDSALNLIRAGEIDWVVNIPRDFDQSGRPDGFEIRRQAVDTGVPLTTDLQLARAIVEALRNVDPQQLQARSWNSFMHTRTRKDRRNPILLSRDIS